MEQEVAPLYSTFGTSGLGLNLMMEAWPQITKLFAAGSAAT
jgi:hypothetical protein